MASYKCDECGACCSGALIVEIYHLDILREPLLLYHTKLMDGNGKIKCDDDMQKEYLLAASTPCAMLGCDNRCKIYPTRPTVCVSMQAGDSQCQTARQVKGLPYLADVDGKLPTDAEIKTLMNEDR